LEQMTNLQQPKIFVMELLLSRTYYKDGTNGELSINGKALCHTIELPWRNNKPCVSCIPEGTYPLVKRWSVHFKNHVLVDQVPGRSFILFHSASNALEDLKGCIAPVGVLLGHGLGNQSKIACKQVKDIVYGAIDNGEKVFLRIVSGPLILSSTQAAVKAA